MLRVSKLVIVAVVEKRVFVFVVFVVSRLFKISVPVFVIFEVYNIVILAIVDCIVPKLDMLREYTLSTFKVVAVTVVEPTDCAVTPVV